MRGYVSLPQFRAPGPLDFSGLNQGIEAVGQKLEKNRLLDQNKAIGSAIQSGGYGDGADAAFAQGNVSLGTQLAGIESAGEDREFNRNRLLTQDRRAAAADARSQELHGLNVQKVKDDMEERFNTRLGVISNAIKGASPEAQTAMWQKVIESHPKMGETLQKYGIDPADVNAGTDFFIAQARGLPTPEKPQYEFTKYGVGNKGTGEITPYGQGSVGADPDRVKLEQDLRKEYAALSKDYRSIQEGADRVKVGANLNNAVGDLSLIFGYMKLLDPGSVVREGEFANAENAQGVPDRIRNVWNKIVAGERLNPDTRQEFVAAAQELANAQTERQNRISKQFHGIATEAGLDPERIIMDFGSGEGSPGSGGKSPFPDYPNARQAPDGNWYVEQNGQYFRIDQ